MKLKLLDIYVKNLHSIGSQPICLEFTKGINAILGKVVGQTTNNGVGKSTIVCDAVVFALFGKSIRGLNLDQMVNSINKRDCIVKLRFEIQGVIYRIERGLNPNFLKLINEDKESDLENSAKKITQNEIDQLIGMSLQSFINMVILNINYSTPFFKMKLAQKRDLLENIMNLSMFGRMFDECKKDVNTYKKTLQRIEIELKGMITHYKSHLETFNKVESLKKNFITCQECESKEMESKIKLLSEKLYALVIPSDNFNDLLDKANDKLSEVNMKCSKCEHIISDCETNLKRLTKDLDYISTNPVCKFCHNPTDSVNTVTYKTDLETSISEFQNKKEDVKIKLIQLKSIKQKLIDKIHTLKDKRFETEELLSIKSKYQSQLKLYTDKLNDINSKTFNIDVIDKKTLLGLKKELEAKKTEFNEIKKKYKISSHMKDVLGDSGIKNYTIRKILPYLNKKMNQHLARLNAHYTISFDANLKETLKSRNRDKFTYDNFSGGEQKRIDVAWLFTSIDIAKMRNSVDCNILALDEVLDSSMCSHGIDMLMEYLTGEFKKSNPNTCVYIITHKSEIAQETFDSIIKLKKENSFTKLDQ